MTTANKQTLLIARGLPGSGKSTRSAAWVAEDPEWRARVNRDDTRFMLYGKYWGLTRMQEENVTLSHHANVNRFLEAGLSVVDDNMNLRASTVKDLYKIANRHGVDVEFLDVHPGVEQCIDNDLHRTRTVGEDVIRKIAGRYLKKGQLPPRPFNDKEADSQMAGRSAVPNPDLPSAVWVDADGTAFSMYTDGVPHRGPFDWDKVHMDHPRPAVIEAVKAFQLAGLKIVVFSGRDEVCHDATRDSFLRHGIVPDDLFMRPAGSMEKDWKVKRDLYWNHAADKYNILFALDDRDQVVKYTRDVLKIDVFQVAPGAF